MILSCRLRKLLDASLLDVSTVNSISEDSQVDLQAQTLDSCGLI